MNEINEFTMYLSGMSIPEVHDKTNNDINNLALMTRSGHSRLHRFEDKLAGKQRRRTKDGKWR